MIGRGNYAANGQKASRSVLLGRGRHGRSHLRILLGAIIYWIMCSCAHSTDLPSGQMGANAFDLVRQFTGRAGGGDGSPPWLRITRAMGVKSILDARDAGFTFVRVPAAGFGPSWPDSPVQNDLALWQADPSKWWSDVDLMFDELDRAGIRLVPSLLFNLIQFPSLESETVTTFLTDPRSRSRDLAKQFISEFISRYRARKTILFYEMGNEFNNGEDMDLEGRCVKQSGRDSPVCRSTGNYSTDALIAFSRDIVALIKRQDPTRGVSSGFGLPRPAATHLIRRPEFAGGPDWTPDSMAEFTDLMLKMHAPFDIVSLHLYPVDVRPELSAYREIDMVDIIARLFHPLGKKVFIGEFGGPDGAPLFGDVANAVGQGMADYAAIWVWEFYQASTHQSPDLEGRDYRIEPGHGEQSMAMLRSALTAPPVGPEPRVVLTWPLPCATVNQPIDLYAVASVGAKLPSKVEFLVDGQSVGVVTSPPYQLRFDPSHLGARVAAVEARAYGRDNSVATFKSSVRFNQTTDACEIGQ